MFTAIAILLAAAAGAVAALAIREAIVMRRARRRPTSPAIEVLSVGHDEHGVHITGRLGDDVALPDFPLGSLRLAGEDVR